MRNKKENKIVKIVMFPIYFIWYIIFGVYVILFSIFKCLYSVLKYIFLGFKTILYIVFYPLIILTKKNKKTEKGAVADRSFDGNVINSQDKVDSMFEKRNKQTLKLEQKNDKKRKKLEKRKAKLKSKNEKEELAFEKVLSERLINEESKHTNSEKIKKQIEKIQKQASIKLEKKHKKEQERQRKIEQKEKAKQEKEQLKLAKNKQDKIKQEEQAFEKELNSRISAEEYKHINSEKIKKQISNVQERYSKKLERKHKKEQERQIKIEQKEKEKLEKEQLRLEKNKQDKIKKEEIRAAKEKAKLDKNEKKLKKKRQTEAYVNEKMSSKEYKSETGINGLIKKIKSIPNKISQAIIKSYENSLLYKDNKNRKDKNHQILLINFDGDDAIKSEQKQVYEYVGKNAEGKIVKDYFPAFSRVEVHSFLLSEGFEVYSIRTSKLINILHKTAGSTIAKFKTKDLIFFLTQLSTYIKAGIPLVESLKILSRQFKNKNYQKIFRAMIYDLTMGENFSSAMEKQGNAFPKLLVNMIKASEMTGELPEALDDMAEYYTEAEQTRKQMITALTYPSVVMIFALGVITFIMVYVVPKFVDIYKSMDEAQIPSFTLLVMNISNFLQRNLIFILIGIVVAIVVFMVLYKNIKSFRWAMQWFTMHIPVVKNIIIYNEVTMFTKTFSSLLSHNVFITDTLEILSKITNNEIYKMLVKDTAANLERGEKISTAYKDQWAFPMPAYEMIVTGEKTGQLAEMMGKVSRYYQDLHKNAVSRIKAFIEPILIVSLTVVVGFIVLSIVIPMFNMYNAIM